MPPYPDEPFSVYSIERAQCAVLLGPFNSADLEQLGEDMGDMGRAYIQAIRNFLSEKMLMPQDKINAAEIREACLSADNKLCVKFATREGALSLNGYKKNLPPGQCCEDFVPPALRAWEDVLIQHGNKVRAEAAPGLPPPKTRRVWQNDTRVRWKRLQSDLMPPIQCLPN